MRDKSPNMRGAFKGARTGIDKDKAPDVKGAFEAAGKGLKQVEKEVPVNAQGALQAAVAALSEVEKRGHLGREGKKALELCQKALGGVPERIKSHAPEPTLRPGGSMTAAADKVDRKVREDQEAWKAKLRESRRGKGKSKGEKER